jgi:Sec-independent protein secretion pathway component TatC
MNFLLRPRSWKIRLLLATIIAAIVTPPDPLSMVIVGLPLFAIGEIVAVLARRLFPHSANSPQP